nr:hypothetical protein [Staphylococcus saprophyticus]
MSGGDKIKGCGLFYGGSILDDMNVEESGLKEEILGGVLGIVRYCEFEDGVKEVNDRNGGL